LSGYALGGGSTRVAGTVVDAVGNTPLVRLTRVLDDVGDAEVWAKLEFRNPGGSVKDRAARQILVDARARGDLSHGRILLDSTSGNTGVAYAMLGAALDVPVELVMPENVSPARKAIIEAYGATIRYSDPLEGSDGAIRLAKSVASGPDGARYWYADQYGNPSNPRAHEQTTAPEILHGTHGRITHFVAALGTSGTVMGTSRGLKRAKPSVHVTAVEPDAAFHGLEGMKHLASSIVPAIYDPRAIDATRFVSTEAGWDMAERLAAEEGLPVGYSAGAAVVAAAALAKELREGVIVTVLCDHADRYNEKPS
jgi:S-sulfo-L-cysteine synthase (O-acetyl-L-serine-dependent)